MGAFGIPVKLGTQIGEICFSFCREGGRVLRGPAAILFISRDTSSDSIAKLFRACFCGVSHNYRAIRSKMGYRTDVAVENDRSAKGRYRTILGDYETPFKKYRVIWGIAAIVSQYRAIWGH